MASASPLVKVMPASALPSRVVRCASASALTETTRACASPLVTVTAASAEPASLTRSASAWACAIARALLALGAPDLGLGLGLGRPDGAGQQLHLLARGLELGQLGLLAGDLLGRLGLGQRTGLGGTRLGGRGLRLGLGAAQRRRPGRR